MTDIDLNAFQRAAEIAAKVPKPFQELAFTRALDELLGKKSGPPERGRKSAAPVRSASRPAATNDLLNAIDRTRYPDVGATDRVADQALKVLQIANDQHDIDGLTAHEISKILSAKFRLKASTAAVRMALSREVGTVDIRQRDDGNQVFHLMSPGEEYLARLRGTPAAAGAAPALSRRRKREGPIPTKKTIEPTRGSPRPSKRTGSPARGGRPGPKAAVSELIKADFFASARTIAQVQEELKHNRGHAYTVQELAPALVRSLRDRTLSRRRNANGQYEYSVR